MLSISMATKRTENTQGTIIVGGKTHSVENLSTHIQNESLMLARVALPTPSFEKQNTAQFFAQIEILLAKTRITADETKHRHVIVTTELEVLALISSIVVNLTPIVALKNVVKSSKNGLTPYCNVRLRKKKA
ncbi:hypothetical protein TNCV_4197851 [Trichonephila clavipes]|nr:hypothetical protein TNCV_4197851 [Trichonephila clavipes]